MASPNTRIRRTVLLFAFALPLLIACQSITSWFRPNVQRGDAPLYGDINANQTSATITPDRYTHAYGNFMGSPNAPVILTEFGDFHCPYCREFYEEHFDDLVRDYIEPGLVYFSYRSAGYFLDGAGQVAEAAYCAQDQEAFWPYHDMIYEQITDRGGYLERDDLLDFADLLNLNTTRFGNCLISGANATRVELDGIHFAELGATGTPSFVINGQLVVSGVNYPALEAAIREALGQQARLHP